MLKAILELLVCLISLNAFAADHEKDLTVESNIIEMDLAGKVAVFKGEVYVKSKVFSLSADVVEVTFSEGKAIVKNKIQSMTAYMIGKGLINADIKSDNKKYKVECRKIAIDMKSNDVLLADAVLNDGKSVVGGEKIIYNLKSEKIVVTGKQNKRVNIVIKNES